MQKMQKRKSHKRMIKKFFTIVEKLIDKVDVIVDSMEKADEIKKITSALKDIKDIGDIMSDNEQREFDLKMERLEDDCRSLPDSDRPFGVVMLPEKMLGEPPQSIDVDSSEATDTSSISPKPHVTFDEGENYEQ